MCWGDTPRARHIALNFIRSDTKHLHHLRWVLFVSVLFALSPLIRLRLCCQNYPSALRRTLVAFLLSFIVRGKSEILNLYPPGAHFKCYDKLFKFIFSKSFAVLRVARYHFLSSLFCVIISLSNTKEI